MSGKRTKIIAEVASNHGGDLALMKEFIRAAADIGVDYIKFQSWQYRKLRDGKKDPQYEWFVRSELSDSSHYELIKECKDRGIRFLTTCFDIDRIDFLSRLGLEEIKVASPDAASYRMLKMLKQRFAHLIISTGMAYEQELVKTAELLKNTNFTFLHCVSLYPVPLDKVNMDRMEKLRRFTPSVGYSDHSVGIEAVKLAIARGADYVEKHFSLKEYKNARVMPWDASREEMKEIVEYARMVEKMSGDGSLNIDSQVEDSRKRYIGRFGDNK